MSIRSLSEDLSPVNNELAATKHLIEQLTEQNKSLTAKNELLERNLKTLSDAVDALTARLDKGESK
jgi:cell division protein FtsB